jgi:hypothetical protein
LPWLGHAIEIASLGLFGWCWAEARRRHLADRRQEAARKTPPAGACLHVELVVAVVYGWLLETLDMRLFGTYHYEPVTWWWIGEVPLYIPLLWAAIIHSSMALSDGAGLPRRARPFLDGLLAVLMDLAIDAIAIRVGLWRWQIPLDQGWFGVPAGNLCAWMWVAAWYGGLTRWARVRIAQRHAPGWFRWLVPPPAYAGLFGSLVAIGLTGRLVGLNGHTERLWIFAGHLAAFGLVVRLAARRAPADRAVSAPRSLLIVRWLMHAGFLLVLAGSGAWRMTPALVAVSAAAMGLEWAAQRRCATIGWSDGEAEDPDRG